MNIIINKKVFAAIMITTLILAVVFVKGSADGTIPGSEADPVVTLSYVELKSEQTKYYIDSLIAKNNQDIVDLKTQLEQKNQEILNLQETVSQLSSDKGFEVVLLNKGQVQS